MVFNAVEIGFAKKLFSGNITNNNEYITLASSVLVI